MEARKARQANNTISTRNLSEEHQENIANYIDLEGYHTVLKTLEKVLDYFEDEIGRDDREGRWLGGGRLSLADVTLGTLMLLFWLKDKSLLPGLYLHRLYQLGLDEKYFQG